MLCCLWDGDANTYSIWLLEDYTNPGNATAFSTGIGKSVLSREVLVYFASHVAVIRSVRVLNLMFISLDREPTLPQTTSLLNKNRYYLLNSRYYSKRFTCSDFINLHIIVPRKVLALPRFYKGGNRGREKVTSPRSPNSRPGFGAQALCSPKCCTCLKVNSITRVFTQFLKYMLEFILWARVFFQIQWLTSVYSFP